MKAFYFILAIAWTGCNNNDHQSKTTNKLDTVNVPAESIPKVIVEKPADTLLPAKVYSNKRFKEVTVEKVGDHAFHVRGLGQIFEASFSWVVEDGHEELKKGFEMTDAGAPEWGKFSFTIDVKKKRANSTLHLILFESSAKDGSRQYELPVLLY